MKNAKNIAKILRGSFHLAHPLWYMMKDGKQKQLIIYNDELQKKLKEIDIKIVQKMFSGIRKQLRTRWQL